MNIDIKKFTKNKTNFVFVGEAGSGKSEIAINFAKYLTLLNEKPVHFFDMDMTKPLFRSRDIKSEIESMGIIFHHQEQFYDAPTMVGGVNLLLKDESCYAVMDVGGNDIGARAIGGFAPKINQDSTVVYYVLNAFRPWSGNLNHIDGTLSSILKISHIKLDKIHMISNPNNGISTTAEEVIEGNLKMDKMIGKLINIDFTCVKDTLYDEVKDKIDMPLLPIHLYLTYPWHE
ncbi:DnaB helicase C-terminal domain-containing protein [Clostridium sp. SYSU_GA19001]|uniref:DnaB helicase C-terminal domain-containing protein n=1 Tax=Clostridium caldaquaticum TaxID=2940653 RepID=UPI0020773F3D|nr:DnaB helicase C-terminal domain-containing protein [Clostridium caldaquaticum]MCM8711911.1 DnaB helicase C-terminal domain-containing protein [Clostridium caldaquaticum]